eukprot:ANDGO_04470.mRNA.1 hypothetical protein
MDLYDLVIHDFKENVGVSLEVRRSFFTKVRESLLMRKGLRKAIVDENGLKTTLYVPFKTPIPTTVLHMHELTTYFHVQLECVIILRCFLHNMPNEDYRSAFVQIRKENKDLGFIIESLAKDIPSDEAITTDIVAAFVKKINSRLQHYKISSDDMVLYFDNAIRLSWISESDIPGDEKIAAGIKQLVTVLNGSSGKVGRADSLIVNERSVIVRKLSIAGSVLPQLEIPLADFGRCTVFNTSTSTGFGVSLISFDASTEDASASWKELFAGVSIPVKEAMYGVCFDSDDPEQQKLFKEILRSRIDQERKRQNMNVGEPATDRTSMQAAPALRSLPKVSVAVSSHTETHSGDAEDQSSDVPSNIHSGPASPQDQLVRLPPGRSQKNAKQRQQEAPSIRTGTDTTIDRTPMNQNGRFAERPKTHPSSAPSKAGGKRTAAKQKASRPPGSAPPKSQLGQRPGKRSLEDVSQGEEAHHIKETKGEAILTGKRSKMARTGGESAAATNAEVECADPLNETVHDDTSRQKGKGAGSSKTPTLSLSTNRQTTNSAAAEDEDVLSPVSLFSDAQLLQNSLANASLDELVLDDELKILTEQIAQIVSSRKTKQQAEAEELKASALRDLKSVSKACSEALQKTVEAQKNEIGKELKDLLDEERGRRSEISSLLSAVSEKKKSYQAWMKKTFAPTISRIQHVSLQKSLKEVETESAKSIRRLEQSKHSILDKLKKDLEGRKTAIITPLSSIQHALFSALRAEAPVPSPLKV